jgi:hypothetical protein
MASDRCNRIVLTVIAGCLVYLCLRDGAPLVQAQAQPQPQPQRPLEVVIVGVDRVRYRFDRWDDLPVRANEPLKVDTSLPLKVKVEPYPPIEVKVTNTPLNVNVANTNR